MALNSTRWSLPSWAFAFIGVVGCGSAAPSSNPPSSEQAGASADAAPPERVASSKSADETDAAVEAMAARSTPTVVDDRPAVTAVKGFEKIRLKPERDGPIIGLIRAGQSVPLKSEEPVTGYGVSRCKGGWYEVLPRGFVCIGKSSTLDRNDPRAIAATALLPDLNGEVPFRVGTMAASAPFYLRIPTKAEQRKEEAKLDAHLKNLPDPTDEHGAIDSKRAGVGPSKAFLAYQKAAKNRLTDRNSAYEGRQVAWAREFDAEGRTWLVTPDMQLVPKDKVRAKAVPTLRGVRLGDDAKFKLPIAFAWLGDIDKFRRNPEGRLAPTGPKWSRHEFVQITGKQHMEHGFVFWETPEGDWVRHTDVTIIKEKPTRPTGVGPNDKWVHVRVTWGSLVAYEGDKPVFATAISPGADGITNRSNGHHTALGLHHIGWKLYSADMDGVDKAKPWAVDEVPFTAYYKDSFAIHGAWWHNEFGRPKSHGCINMSPPDARWLWTWMDPGMPEGWYAVTAYYPEVKGTTVEIRQ